MSEYFIDLDNLMCPNGHTNLQVVGTNRELIEVRCEDCHITFFDTDLLPRSEPEDE